MANSLPKFYTQTLENGLQVVAIPMENKTNVVSTDIYYKVGSRNEIMGKSGIAHMLEHLNFKSTDNMKAGEFDEIVKGFGGVNNASTGFDYTHYFINSSSSNMDKSLSLFADMMENLALKDEEFQPERDVVTEERRWRTDNNPIGYLYFRLFNNLFLYHPYHWTPIGFMDDIRNWTIDDIKDFHSMFYQPKNAIIVVSGDINKEDVFASAKKYFSKIKNTKEIRKVHMKEPAQDGKKEIIIHKKTQVEMIAIAFHIPNYLHKDQVALSVLSEVLSSGKSSRLNSDLIDKKQLANSIYAYNMEQVDAGVYLFMAVCNGDVDANDVKKELLEHIEKIKTEEITKAELDKIKLNTKYDFITSLESASDVSNLFGGYFAKGDITPLLEYEENLEKVTSKDLQEVAKKYFTQKNMTIVILKDEE
jgi:predicted Zn-dependent peptidase